MKEIGQKLKEKREENGVSLEEAADDLKIRASQLESIEKGNKEDFKDVSDEEFKNMLNNPIYYEAVEKDSNENTDEDVEELDECSLNENVSNYLSNMYKNVKSFETTRCSLDQNKLIIEGILQDLHKVHKDFNICILRYFNPIGAHKSGLIGEDPNGIPNNLMPFITQVAIGKREYLGVFGNDYETSDGTGVRDYIHVVDLALGHVRALEKMNKDNGLFIYNLGTGKGTSVLEMVHAFEDANNLKINYKIMERRSGDIAECYANCDKANRELNWVAKYTVLDACRDSWNWQSKNPNGYED